MRVYGIGRVGSATRMYSVKLSGSGSALDVLKAPAHAGGNLTVSSAVTATGGALSTNGTLTVSATITGDAQATAQLALLTLPEGFSGSTRLDDDLNSAVHIDGPDR